MPRTLTWLARSTVLCALTIGFFAAPRPLEAQRTAATSVAVRNVHVSTDPSLAAPLRDVVEEALASFDVERGNRPGFVLDVAVTRLSQQSMTVGSRIDCEISVVVEDARRHAIRSVLTGRARVIGDSGDALTHAALRAAARGALRSLPTALASR